MNVVVDTCVIIDALQQREPFYKDAQAICLAIADDKVTGFITAKSVTDIYYLMHHFLHSDENVRNILKNLLVIFGILDTTALDCRIALTSPVNDFEDALLVETAYRNGIEYIITRNIKDYTHSIIPVITPFEFLKKISSNGE